MVSRPPLLGSQLAGLGIYLTMLARCLATMAVSFGNVGQLTRLQ